MVTCTVLCHTDAQVVRGQAADDSNDAWSSSTDVTDPHGAVPHGAKQSVRVDGETVVLRRNTGGMARRRGNSADIEAAPSPSPPPPADFEGTARYSGTLFLPVELTIVVLHCTKLGADAF